MYTSISYRSPAQKGMLSIRQYENTKDSHVILATFTNLNISGLWSYSTCWPDDASFHLEAEDNTWYGTLMHKQNMV